MSSSRSTAAARLLGLPKTTVSRRFAAPEREVGVRLLQRTTRSLSMTDAGRLYYERSSQALRTIEDANLRCGSESGAVGHNSYFGSSRLSHHFLTSTMLHFLATHPKTKIECALPKTGSIRARTESTRLPHPDLSGFTLIARKLGSMHRILCQPGLSARRGVPEAPADLVRHHCIIERQSAASAHWVLDGPHGQETVTVSGRFAANEMQAVIAATIAGYGIAELPDGIAEASIRDGRLRRVSRYATPAGGLYVVYPSSQHLPPMVKAFIELAAERVSAAGTSENDETVPVPG